MAIPKKGKAAGSKKGPGRGSKAVSKKGPGRNAAPGPKAADAKRAAPKQKKSVPGPARAFIPSARPPGEAAGHVRFAASIEPAAPAHREPEAGRPLAEAREQIRGLIADRDEQVALAEAAEMEREVLEAELAEARERIRALEKDLTEKPSTGSTPARDAEEGTLGFEEEEEEEEPTESDDLDDVEEIYNRMDDPRVRRQELDRERIDRESQAGDEPYWRVCPKCGDSLDEVESEDVKIDRCETCGGIYLDHGEIEMLLSIARGTHGLRRVRSALQI